MDLRSQNCPPDRRGRGGTSGVVHANLTGTRLLENRIKFFSLVRARLSFSLSLSLPFSLVLSLSLSLSLPLSLSLSLSRFVSEGGGGGSDVVEMHGGGGVGRILRRSASSWCLVLLCTGVSTWLTSPAKRRCVSSHPLDLLCLSGIMSESCQQHFPLCVRTEASRSQPK